MHKRTHEADNKCLKLITPTQRLAEIASIIEFVDNRALAADGPVTKTRFEMTDQELRDIYKLAKGASK